jgi:acetoin utilization deacetylase AcuC-like enzyme
MDSLYFLLSKATYRPTVPRILDLDEPLSARCFSPTGLSERRRKRPCALNSILILNFECLRCGRRVVASTMQDGESKAEIIVVFNQPKLDDKAQQNDELDIFNHPRQRQNIIIEELHNPSEKCARFGFENPRPSSMQDLQIYELVHSQRLLQFYASAWQRWVAEKDLHRPSANVQGQMGFFCTDDTTPVFAELFDELCMDAAVIDRSIRLLLDEGKTCVYSIPIHPGHHATSEVFGGYCYLNHAAASARILQQRIEDRSFAKEKPKVAILDVDFHCGDGTACIFDEDPSVLVISIHCHPDWDYPFHTGYEDQVGSEAGRGATIHLPLMPQTTWIEYEKALNTAMETIQEFAPEALVVSLGLDTHIDDPVPLEGAGFLLQRNDYVNMGQSIGARVAPSLPTLFVQEGGYKLDTIGSAVADVLSGFVSARVET